MRIVLVGKGLMGKVFYHRYKSEIVAWVDSDSELKELNIQSDVLVDFSRPSMINAIINYIKEENIPSRYGAAAQSRSGNKASDIFNASVTADSNQRPPGKSDEKRIICRTDHAIRV